MGHIIAVHSASGGAGCTTLAVNLAARFALRRARTLLIDLSLPYGDVGAFLNLNRETSLLDAVSGEVSSERLESSRVRHDTGLDVLLAPQRPTDADHVSPEQIQQLLTVAADSHDFTVVDLGHDAHENALTAMDAASVVVLLLMPTLSGVKNARLALDRFQSWMFPTDKIVTVLNRVAPELVEKRLNIDQTRIEKFLKTPLDASLPDDVPAALIALNKGVPIYERTSEAGSLSKVLNDFGDYIFRMLVYEPDEVSTAPIRTEARPPASPAASTVPAQKSIPQRADGTISIFIVDDLPDVQINLKKLLAFEMDFKVVGTAGSGVEALAQISDLKPDIVLLDVTLPDMDSLEVVSQVAKISPATAVIMLSLDDGADLMRRAMLAGAREFLTKPVDMDKTYSTIRRTYSSYAPMRLQADQPSPTVLSARRPTPDSGSASGLPLRPAPDKTAAREEPAPSQTPMSKRRPGLFSLDSSSSGSSGLSIPPPPLERTLFSAYYPREAYVGHKHGLFVYAHIEAALDKILKDVEKFKEELGGTIPQSRVAKQEAHVAFGTAITVTPESETLQFEPASVTKRWRGPFTRFDFDFFPTPETADETALVRVSIQIANVEVAFIKCGIEIAASAPIKAESAAPTPDNPLAAARYNSQRGETYRKIFISYSRKDIEVARAYQMAQVAMGNEVFIDVDGLRAGENWQAALARAIDTADIFQMFWSSSYADSEYCRYEWDYALKYRCSDDHCEGFIRPVYWVQPMPAPPPEPLSHLNFKYVPFNLK